MQKQVDIIFFSPTGTTKKISLETAKGMNYKPNIIDITKKQQRGKVATLSSDAVIISVPVYEGQIPLLLNEYFTRLTGNGQPLIIITVYGNIEGGIALNQLMQMAKNSNFKVIAAAEFIGEHSFANNKVQVGYGRPNQSDLQQSFNFGKAVCDKISNYNTQVHIPKGKLPIIAKILPKSSAKIFAKQPSVNTVLCNNCGACVLACPVEAIDKQSLDINEAICLRCFACVKKCPKKAREIKFKIFIAKIVLKYLGRNTHNNKIYL